MRAGPTKRSIPAIARSGLSILAACALALFATHAQATDAAAEPVQEPVQQVISQPLRTAKLANLGGQLASPDVRHIANWAVHSRDPAGLPFLVVDKVDGQVFVFDADGQLLGSSTALVGAARGDTSVPGIGSRKLSSILPDERTTPAGRFPATMGLGPKGEDILWVDYEGAVAIHRVVTGVAKERRLQRLESKVALDRRITYGCINVPVKFYESIVAPTFKARGGVVYVLPETRRPQELFGSYDVGNDAPVQAASQPSSPLRVLASDQEPAR